MISLVLLTIILVATFQARAGENNQHILFPRDRKFGAYLDIQAEGTVCIYSFYSGNEPFWCSRPLHMKEYIAPTIFDDMNDHITIKSHRTTEEAILEQYQDLGEDDEYDIEFIDPLEEVKWICSSILWRCREVTHEGGLIPRMAAIRKTIFDTNSVLTFPAAELEALKDLYDSAGGTEWIWRKDVAKYGIPWNFSQSDLNPCVDVWQGIICNCEIYKGIGFYDDPGHPGYYYYDGYIGGNTSNSCNVVKLVMIGMGISGSLPETIGNFTKLTHLHLNDGLTGTIPPSFANLGELRVMTLARNSFISIPSDIARLQKLYYMGMQQTNLVGSSLPESIANMSQLQYLYFYQTGIGGSIPEGVWALPDLLVISFSDSLITGSISSTIGNISHLGSLELSNNRMTGELPPQITNLQYLQFLRLANNYFHGTIPENMGNLKSLTFVNVSSNNFYGSIPSGICHLYYAQNLFLYNNAFTSQFPDCFPAGNISSWRILDLSRNQITGSLPVSIFKVSSLQVFAAVENCFEAFSLEEVCDAQALEVLALDGLRSASTCQVRLFPGAKTYLLDGLNSVNIPDCLFAMNTLQTLHLSGNSIQGTLSHSLVIGDKLVDLVLSHNLLSGDIPEVIQTRQWTRLDLSFNKLSGYLRQSISPLFNGSELILKSNRLSGQVPAALIPATTIDILSGNLFQCDYYTAGHGLPDHDPAMQTYNCSNSFEQLFYLWAFPAAMVMIFLSVIFCFHRYIISSALYHKWSHLDPRFSHWISTYQSASVVFYDSFPSLHKFRRFGAYLRSSYIKVSCYALFLVLPVYVVLSHFYQTYEFKYTWTTSSVYLSGFTPAVVVTVVTTVLCLLCFYYFDHHTKTYAAECFVSVKNRTKESSWLTTGLLCVIAIFNIVVVIAVYFGFVVLTQNSSGKVLIFAQFSVGLFKLFWHDVALILLLRVGKSIISNKSNIERKEEEYFFDGQDVLFLSVIVAFNNIIAPMATTAAVHPNCFSSYFFRDKKIQASYEFIECLYFNAANRALCYGKQSVSSTTFYYPPYEYSYQCSSALITAHTSVHVYMFISMGFWAPLFDLMLLNINTYLRFDRGILYFLMFLMTPDIMKPVNAERLGTDLILFDKTQFTLRIVSCATVLITFGVTFPILSLVICGAVHSVTYFPLYAMGLVLDDARRADEREQNEEREYITKYLETLEIELHGIPKALVGIMWHLMPFASVFHALIIFDMIGDVTGWRGALTLTFILLCLPMTIMTIFLILRYKCSCLFSAFQKITDKVFPHTGSSFDAKEVGNELPSLFQPLDVGLIEKNEFMVENQQADAVIQEDLDDNKKAEQLRRPSRRRSSLIEEFQKHSISAAVADLSYLSPRNSRKIANDISP